MTAPDHRTPGEANARCQLDPLPFKLLDEPLDYLFADHFRERCLTQALRKFAAVGSAPRVEADHVIAYLLHEQPLHHADEEEDLFPLLRRRARPDDELGPILAQLAEDHRRLAPMVDEIVAVLGAQPAKDLVRLRRHMRELLKAYAANEAHHVAIENGIVLVMARKRLNAADLQTMSHAMKARRGVNL